MATTKNIQSIERAFYILESFRMLDEVEMSLKDIADTSGLNKSTTYGIVNTLNNLGYLQQNAENQKYRLGVKILSLSDSVSVYNSIIQTIHPYMEKLCKKYKETFHCAVENTGEVLYLDKVVYPKAISINSHIGASEKWLHCSGVGKCLLAYMSEDRREQVLQSELRPMTRSTITDPERLRDEIRKVWESGYAVENSEVEMGLSCIAVPVLSETGEAICAISISATTPSIQIAVEDGVVGDLKRTAAEIAQELKA